MDDMTAWLQSNWYEFGSLLVQFAILATLAWFGRGLLRMLRAFLTREQIQPTSALSNAAEAEYDNGMASAWSGLLSWLQEPMGSSADGPFRRMMRWLQAPMGG